MLRLTPVVKNLIIINVVVFLVGFILPGLHLNYFLALHNFRTEAFQPYQLFTYMFVHDGISHIFFNMLALAFSGPILESQWGAQKFVIFYTLCGLGAAAFNIAVDYFLGAGSFGSLVGASGATYGILTAFGLLFPNMEMMLMFIPVPIKAKYIVLGFAGLALYSALNPTPGDNTAHFTHIGGIVVAILLVQFWRGLRY